MKYNAPYGSTDPDAPYLDRDTPALQRGSVPPAAAIEQPQREIVDVITKAGMTPDDPLQLWDALLRLGLTPGNKSRRWMAIISMTTSAPPAGPADGDAYLVPAGATGAWAAQVGKIAEWTGAAWSYVLAPNGHGVALPDGRLFERIGGTYVEKIAMDVQSGKWGFAAAGGSANALTATLAPPVGALTNGMSVRIYVATTNTASNPTLNIGPGAVTIVWADGTPVAAGDLLAGHIYELNYNAISNRWEVNGLSPAQAVKANSQVAILISVTAVGAGSWVAPADGWYVFEIWGAGGGGGWGGSSGFGSGGGSGSFTEEAFFLAAGQTVNYIVGAGGAAGTSAGNGSVGGLSRVTIAGVNYDVAGGTGGISSASSHGSASGMSAASTWGRRRLRGTSGKLGKVASSALGGDGGDAPFGGGGGPGGFAAVPGIQPGGGGGASAGNGAAAAGGAGQINILGRIL